MDFNPDIAQMAFGLYLAFFVVFMIQRSVAGLGGVPMGVLVLHAATALIWIAVLMILVVTKTTATGAVGVVLWATTFVVTAAYIFAMLWDISTQRQTEQKLALTRIASVADANSEWNRYKGRPFWERFGHRFTGTVPARPR
jgi:hypothetical protein